MWGDIGVMWGDIGVMRGDISFICGDMGVKWGDIGVKNLGVIFDSRLYFEHHIKSLCSPLNGTLSYLNRVKNTLDQKSRILLINALIFSHLNYCSSIWGKCSEELQYEVQKCI